MTKRSLFLAVAATVVTSLAFASPSRADTEVLTTISLAGIAPDTITDIDIFYKGVTTVSGLTLTGGTLVPVSSLASPANGEVVVTFSTTEQTGTLDFTFTSPLSGPLGLDHYSYSGGSSANIQNLDSDVTVSAVPEPTSMALLGIGMTGFLAFRRLFKRNSAA